MMCFVVFCAQCFAKFFFTVFSDFIWRILFFRRVFPLSILQQQAFMSLLTLSLYRAPESSPIKSKMLYAGTKNDLKKSLQGLSVEIQGTDRAEVGMLINSFRFIKLECCRIMYLSL